jgi:DnaJ-class molecular chaperone
MTYTCPRCGRSHFTENDMRRCPCQNLKICPTCGGSGKVAEAFAPNQKCSTCGGSGKVSY